MVIRKIVLVIVATFQYRRTRWLWSLGEKLLDRTCGVVRPVLYELHTGR